MSLSPVENVSFTLNGVAVTLHQPSPHLSLNEWLRAQPGLTGTKVMCGEGGCGCCVVAATVTDPSTSQSKTYAINSCLCSLYGVEGWKIRTVEGVGNSRDGLHAVQQRISEYNGSQCGYCTPGMVMTMFSLLQDTPRPTMQQVEDNFDGNLCRCTGYRPILDAMKTFASDSGKPSVDIEDLGAVKTCSNCPALSSWKMASRQSSDPLWYRPNNVSQVFEIFDAHPNATVRLVCGDTGRGVFKNEPPPDIAVLLTAVSELHVTEVGDRHMGVGSAISLSNLISLLLDNQEKSSSFSHIAKHLKQIASVPVRNLGSWAGNLMLTHAHNNFPSDVFTVMGAAGASVTVATSSGRGEYPLCDFLKLDMSQSVIVSLQIPYSSENEVFHSYKIMPRAENAHAYVNAAFRMSVDSNLMTVKEPPSFVFGGIGEKAISTPATEKFLVGKSMLDESTLAGALQQLSGEISPNVFPASASPEYRKSLAMGLFYKFVLSVLGERASAQVKSAAEPFIRAVSQGSQSYDSNPAEYPISKPMTKLTAPLQASGEAEYTTDIPTQGGELAAAFVLTTVGNAKITGIDTSAAMTMPGAVMVLTAKDIPANGSNNFVPLDCMDYVPEPVLAEEVSEYAGQAVALVIADTQEHANHMAQAVGINYQSIGAPLLTIKDAIAANSFYDSPDESDVVKIGNAEAAIAGSDHVISGEVGCGTQYHFTMETQASLVIPGDDGFQVYASTQWAQMTQAAVAAVLGIKDSSVSVSVKRVGGGYGAKISRSCQISSACALGAYHSRRPVRMHMDLDSNMKMAGRRYPYYCKYTVGCSKEGILAGIKVDIYCDAGCSSNEQSISLAVMLLDNVYRCPAWLVTPRACKTHTPSNVYCRAPGSLPGIFIMESIMDDMARSLGMDVEQVKEANFYKKGDISYLSTPGSSQGMPLNYCSIGDVWSQIWQSANITDRKNTASDFNKANRWRKRGLAVCPLRFGLTWSGVYTTAMVTVFARDGTIAVTHGGIEIGQGINTKVAQVVAQTLDVPLELVFIKPSTAFLNPNGESTGGSTTSELCCQAVLKASQMLRSRLDQIRKKMDSNSSWLEVVQAAYKNGVDLSEKYFLNPTSKYPFAYNSYGATCAEVEIDVLTGQPQILRVDILYDCGQSINPLVDIGQVEGAFVMGLGYWLTEKVEYDAKSGQLLTHNTWEYKPPSSKDIPIDFRVALLKNAPNPLGVLRSKAVGEPPQCMSCAVFFAVKRAIESARQEVTQDNSPFQMVAPATVETIQQSCLVSPSQFSL